MFIGVYMLQYDIVLILFWFDMFDLIEINEVVACFWLGCCQGLQWIVCSVYWMPMCSPFLEPCRDWNHQVSFIHLHSYNNRYRCYIQLFMLVVLGWLILAVCHWGRCRCMGDQCKHIRGFDTFCRCSDACLAVPAQLTEGLSNLMYRWIVTLASTMQGYPMYLGKL